MGKKRNIKSLTSKSLDWTFDAGETGDTVSDEKLNLSCQMRIADAVENIAANTKLMTKNYLDMQNQLSYYIARTAQLKDEVEQLKLSRAGHKAAFTKLKNKVEENKNVEN